MNGELSTGLPELDRLLHGLLPGDNVVWQVESIQDYLAFVYPFCEVARRNGERLIYFSFGRHAPLMPDEPGVDVNCVDPHAGFEPFLDKIHSVIEEAGRGACFVFDCLSDLAADWFSDQMLANFFRLTCPYLLDMEDLAYFGLLRNVHSANAAIPIRNTTQVLLDVYRYKDSIYVRPLKADKRRSPAIYLLHQWRAGDFVPVTESSTTAEVLTSTPRSVLESAMDRLDVWNRAFLLADQRRLAAAAAPAVAAEPGEAGPDQFERLLRMIVSRDQRVLALARRYLTIEGILAIARRTIGTGLIGGKAVGMLLARSILEKDDPRWRHLLEVHDSFHVASDVFYTYLVENGCWWIRRKQKDLETFLDSAEQGRQRILAGQFPAAIVRQFNDMLDYFGASPIIVRSSSLLEDNFGNSFAGKYESVFCANQGSPEQRLEDFLAAVKTIYASTMSEEALNYRARHGILERDEQMALLVQRVSGGRHGRLYYPQLAGVGFSFNPFVWHEAIDPEAGLLRLVFGLGTRAVDRADDDYTRIVALNAPERRPDAASGHGRFHAQRRVDVLDLERNQHMTKNFSAFDERDLAGSLNLFASVPARDRHADGTAGSPPSPCILDFAQVITETSFIEDMRSMLNVLERAYEYPVDVEFTANFSDAAQYRINVVQCRPLQVKGGASVGAAPEGIESCNILLESHGPVIGHSRIETIDQILFVVPSAYAELTNSDKYLVARLIGQIAARTSAAEGITRLVMGPGRWGTSMPSLGVPVKFSEISGATVLCEIVAMREGLSPDVSMGTHFFSELVETDMLYMAVFPGQDEHCLNQAALMNAPNELTELVPDAEALAHVVRVIHPVDAVRIFADTIRQHALCYREA